MCAEKLSSQIDEETSKNVSRHTFILWVQFFSCSSRIPMPRILKFLAKLFESALIG